MRNLKKEKRNIVLGCLILVMFGCLNLALSLDRAEPQVYWNDQRYPLQVDHNLQVTVEDFCKQLALDYEIVDNQLYLGENSKHVIDLTSLNIAQADDKDAMHLVSLEQLCHSMGIPYVWDESQQMVMLGDTKGNAKVIPVLMYHHLLPEKDIQGIFVNNNIVVSVEQFQQQINYLQDNGYQTVSLGQLTRYINGEQLLPDKSVVITFDDGYLSNYEYAYPILKEADFQAVIFLLTGFIEEHDQVFNPKLVQYLGWNQVKQMSDVFELASHTHDMHKLSPSNGRGVLSVASANEIVSDLRLSRQSLSGTKYFSYPYGHYSQLAVDILKKQGIALAFTVNEGSVKIGDDPMMLNRWDVYRYRELEQFKNLFK